MFTKLYHPLVMFNGAICLCELQQKDWRPLKGIMSPVDKLHDEMANVRTYHSFNQEVEEISQHNPEQFLATATEWNEKFAMNPD